MASAEPESALRLPRSIMVGSVGRNTGKTEFACALIRSMGARHPVNALKVTTVSGERSTCPRGGEGCGVCSSLREEYCLTAETDRGGRKDTSRMLVAGAGRVFWLRVRERSLAQAVAELPPLVPAGGVLVCESNSLRKVCEPDLFFMLGDPGRPDRKESAAAVSADVDRFVRFDGAAFDIAVDTVRLSGEHCAYPADAGAIVLAGGRSVRMGEDKRYLDVGGIPLVEHVYRRVAPLFSEVLLSVAGLSDVEIAGARTVIDRVAGGGPMEGVASALEASRHDINFVVACDIPTAPLELIRSLLRLAREHDVVVPVDAEGRLEPLFAVYRRRVLPRLRDLLRRGERRIRLLYGVVDTGYYTLPAGVELRNLNTKADYRAFLAE